MKKKVVYNALFWGLILCSSGIGFLLFDLVISEATSPSVILDIVFVPFTRIVVLVYFCLSLFAISLFTSFNK